MSPHSSDDDDDRRRRSKKSHKRKREHKQRSSRGESGSDAGQSDDGEASYSSNGRYKKRRRKERKKRSKISHDDSSDEVYKKRRRKEKKSKKKAKKRGYPIRSRSRSPSSDQNRGTHQAAHVPPGAHELASSLSTLLESYPAMASMDEGGIPLLLIQLSRGTEYNLSSMPDTRLANLIGGVFASLRVHGMELLNGVWKWGNAPPGSRGGDDLALVKLTRALLASVGVSMDSVVDYEEAEGRRASQQVQPTPQQRGPAKPEQSEESEDAIRHRKRIERMSTSMLDRFDSKDSSAPAKSAESTLANELQGIISVLKDGETVQLEGLENGKLKATLAQLFDLIGLELVEMEDEEDDQDDISHAEKTLGYAVPDEVDAQRIVLSNLHEVVRVCKYRSSGNTQHAPSSWRRSNDESKQTDSGSDDDEGPAPLGTMAAVKASKRKRIPRVQTSKESQVEEGGREEWMMVPGEHDFLKGISKSTRGRTFKNEKQRGQPIASDSNRPAEPINAEVLEEVNAIQRAYEQSRGPSLLDAHRQKQHETKESEKGKKNDWKWNREKNLDDGRRVDKNALHMVMGNASAELKNKFAGRLG